MARVFFTFNPMSALLFIGAVVIGIPAALIMLTMWLHVDSSEDAFIKDIESQIGPIHQPRDVVEDGKTLCDSFEHEAEGMPEFDEESRVHDIKVTDFGAVHGNDKEITANEAKVIVNAAEKHLCDASG
ncbi:DUF732 domain-containing protein [Brevibacterium picturae]|uniref:DUF732 domain-containing protein n=1 Tax=Brevibacterium picturae TaxID=260553 RepID=A0ABP4MYL9_9MICO